MLWQLHSWGTLTSSGELGSSPEPTLWPPSQQPPRTLNPAGDALNCKPQPQTEAQLSLSHLLLQLLFGLLNSTKVITFLALLLLMVYTHWGALGLFWFGDIFIFFLSWGNAERKTTFTHWPVTPPCLLLFFEWYRMTSPMCLNSAVFQMIVYSQQLTLFFFGETESL